MTPYPRIIAHRCGGALAPENTLPGLKIAHRLGCRAVEFDVMLSHDGVPLLIHDERVERTTGGHGNVPDLTAAQIRALDAGRIRHPAYAGTRVPTLAEALADLAALGLWANIEIKPAQGYETRTGTVVATQLAAGWNAHGIVSSFSHEALVSARAHSPTLPIALLFETLPPDWQARMAQLNAIAVHLDATRVDASVAQALSGVPWACYTVNSVEQAECLFALGCHAIFTDRPDLWS